MGMALVLDSKIYVVFLPHVPQKWIDLNKNHLLINLFFPLGSKAMRKDFLKTHGSIRIVVGMNM